MEKEIETRFLDVDKKKLIEKLLAYGAVDKGEQKLDETIFHAADGSWLGKGKFVRLRKKGENITLTYKTNQQQQIDSAREIEFEVPDLKKCSDFLREVGLKPMRRAEKLRHTFRIGDVAVDIDTWPKIPVYAEFEGPSVESLKNACANLGLDWEKRFDGDAREVFRHYGYAMDELSVVTFTEFH